MGGRGASSSGKSSGSLGTGRGGGMFYDRTDKFQGMSLHEFENAIRGKSVEYIGVFDSGGKLALAGTSYNKGSVTVPARDPRFPQNDAVITHNHPSGGGRGLGGTFSEADIKMLAQTNAKSIRAVANGRGEHTYIMQKSTTRTADTHGLARAVQNVETSGAMKAAGNKALDTVRKKFKASGKTLTTEQTNSIYLGGMKNVWRDVANKNGYDYVPLKKAPW